jgi:hypothetical protein
MVSRYHTLEIKVFAVFTLFFIKAKDSTTKWLSLVHTW